MENICIKYRVGVFLRSRFVYLYWLQIFYHNLPKLKLLSLEIAYELKTHQFMEKT